ncbi:MAG: alpha/beta hydrolase [Firmicutes bacterium]|nr:alpha/beta hydrolase [Bacillota bacterium]
MKKESIIIESIPAILWGEKSNIGYIYVHGKLSDKEDARGFAEKSVPKGYQVLSFDLPEHGERLTANYPCTVWNSVLDLNTISKYAQRNWSDICLYGNSLGAYFSLLAYKDLPLRKCLFLSPILDMERLIQNMMRWSNISEQELKDKQEIPTTMGEILSWDYYCYVKKNPINKWKTPTSILYGSADNLTERVIVERFANRFACNLDVLEGSEHWFHTDLQLAYYDEWVDKNV